jgi:hypothetical protein
MFINKVVIIGGEYMQNSSLEAIYNVIERGMAAKEVVCSITTRFRSIPSLRTKPGLNPYHASVADIGYGFDSVQGTINRIRMGESIPFAFEMLVFELDTLRISEKQLSPNFELVVMGAPPEFYYLVTYSRYLNKQIGEMITEAIRISQELLGDKWYEIHSRIQNIQAIPRL